MAGGPPWAVPLVLIPADALHEGEKYSVEKGKKYLARLKQLSKDDIFLWSEKVDKFGGTELDAALNIILLDEFFSKESFQRDKFKAAVKKSEAIGPPKQVDRPKTVTDIKAIQGIWQVIAMEEGGITLSKEKVEELKLRFIVRENALSIMTTNRGGVVVGQGLIKLNEKTSPKHSIWPRMG